MDLTALTLFGRARYKVLAGLFGLGAAESIHLRELARRTGLSPTATQYELRLLLQTGLVLQAGAGVPVGEPAQGRELRILGGGTGRRYRRTSSFGSCVCRRAPCWSAGRR